LLPPDLPDLHGLDGGVERLLTVRQVAGALGVCTATVYKWAADGELPHIRIVNVIRVRPGDLIRLVTDRRRFCT
jgi:excisionase family DNA binding protein